MNPYYQFALSFSIIGSPGVMPPEILLPPNITPLVPPVGAVLNIPDGNGNLIQGTVQSFAYSIDPGKTVVIVFIAPVVPGPPKAA